MDSDSEAPSLDNLPNVLFQRKGEQWALLNIMTTPDIDEVVQDILNGTTVGISDGSYKEGGVTSAWI